MPAERASHYEVIPPSSTLHHRNNVRKIIRWCPKTLFSKVPGDLDAANIWEARDAIILFAIYEFLNRVRQIQE
jgi:hypothetical protein